MVINFLNLGFLSNKATKSISNLLEKKESPQTEYFGYEIFLGFSIYITLVLAITISVLSYLYLSFFYPADQIKSTPYPNLDKSIDVIDMFSLEILSVEQNNISTVVLVLIALMGLALVLGLLASFLHMLRKLNNPLYWEISCWFLIALGILIRPLVIGNNVFHQEIIIGTLIAGILSLGVFPVLMRLLNKIKHEPGLIHVSLPFSLGFFLDIAQLITLTYIPDIKFAI